MTDKYIQWEVNTNTDKTDIDKTTLFKVDYPSKKFEIF